MKPLVSFYFKFPFFKDIYKLSYWRLLLSITKFHPNMLETVPTSTHIRISKIIVEH